MYIIKVSQLQSNNNITNSIAIAEKQKKKQHLPNILSFRIAAREMTVLWAHPLRKSNNLLHKKIVVKRFLHKKKLYILVRPTTK